MRSQRGSFVAKRHDLQKRAMIGKNLAHARALAGFSQSDVMRMVWAEKNPTQKNRISEVESGKSLPDAELLSELCQLYGVSADYICGLSAEPEIDQTAGRVGMIYTGLTEIAATATQQMVENLSRISASYIAAMPKPHAMALLDAAKTVWRDYGAVPHDKIRQQYPDLSQSLFEMFKITQEFDRSQAINLTGYELALDEVLQRNSNDPRHFIATDAIPRLKRYPCTSLPSCSGRRRKRKPTNQMQLEWPKRCDIPMDNSED
jgi:transcriptional regulator with XRE-family HTH domain